MIIFHNLTSRLSTKKNLQKVHVKSIFHNSTLFFSKKIWCISHNSNGFPIRDIHWGPWPVWCSLNTDNHTTGRFRKTNSSRNYTVKFPENAMRQRNIPKPDTINESGPYSYSRNQNAVLYIQEFCFAVPLLSLCSEEIKLPPHLQFPNSFIALLPPLPTH